MANQCCVCNKKLSIFDGGETIVSGLEEYKLCFDCNTYRRRLRYAVTETEYLQCEAHFENLRNNPKTPYPIKEYFNKIHEAWLERIGKAEKVKTEKEQHEAEIKNNLNNMKLTTGSHFEGYHVVKYLDVLCEEVVFKNSFMNRLSAGFEDIGNALSFQETEMSGSGELIGRARAYVKEKFRHSAAEMGANAVLGIEFESSIGADIVRVAMFGTAVIIKPLVDMSAE